MNDHGARRPLPPLLPATTGTPHPPCPSRKRVRVNGACDICRERKTKCTMERPSCRECAKRTTICHYREQGPVVRRRYDELRARTTEHEELFELIRSLPEAEALDIVYRVRSNLNIETILAHVKNGDLIMQLSVVPESNRRYSFPYRLEMPSYLLDPQNPYLQSSLYDATWKPEGKGRDTNPDSSILPANVEASAYTAYYKPFQAAELVEPLLSRVTAARWTTLNLSDVLFRDLLSSFILYIHPLLYCFHVPIFLQDMADGKTRFCTPLLVHSVLGAAYMTYKRDQNRAQYWQPDNLGYRLSAEARRLWDLECADRARLTTIQAAIILNFTTDVICIDHLGEMYLTKAIAMSRATDLFNPAKASQSGKTKKTRTLLAWALYNWCTYEAFYMRQVPRIKEPPPMPFPDPFVDQNFHAEIWLKYPLCADPVPSHFAQTYLARAGLRRIMNDMAFDIRHRRKSMPPMTFDDVLAYQARLDDWTQGLSTAMQPHNIVFPTQIEIHLEYHNIILELFQDYGAGGNPDLVSRMTHQSNINIETLLRLYYSRHSFEGYGGLMLVFLAHVSSQAIQRLKYLPLSKIMTEETRSSLILSAIGMRTISQSSPVARLSFYAYCVKMSSEDLNLLWQYGGLDEFAHDEQSLIRQAHSSFPIPIYDEHPEQTSPQFVKLNNLIQVSDSSDSTTDDESQ